MTRSFLLTVLLINLSFAFAQSGGGASGGASGGAADVTGGSDAVSPEEFATLQTATYEVYPTEVGDVNGVVQVVENVDGGARVVVTLLETEGNRAYPAHFHAGDCGSGGEIVYPLEAVPSSAEGNTAAEVTTVDTSVFDIINRDLYINIHQPGDLSTILACGEVGLGANAQWR